PSQDGSPLFAEMMPWPEGAISQIAIGAPRIALSNALHPAQLVRLHHEPDHHLHRLPAQRFLVGGAADILAENLREGRPVGDVEEAKRADLPVDFQRIEP